MKTVIELSRQLDHLNRTHLATQAELEALVIISEEELYGHAIVQDIKSSRGNFNLKNVLVLMIMHH